MLWLAVLSFLAPMDLRQNSMPRGKGFLSSFYIAFWPGHFITAQKVERAPACSITGLRRMSSVALFEDIWGRFLSYSKTPPSLGTEVPKMPHSVKYLEDVNAAFLCEVECYVLIIQFALSVSYIKVLSHSCFKLGLRSFLLYPHYRFRLETKTRPWEVRGGPLLSYNDTWSWFRMLYSNTTQGTLSNIPETRSWLFSKGPNVKDSFPECCCWQVAEFEI